MQMLKFFCKYSQGNNLTVKVLALKYFLLYGISLNSMLCNTLDLAGGHTLWKNGVTTQSKISDR